jgi:hypothetical protein
MKELRAELDSLEERKGDLSGQLAALKQACFPFISWLCLYVDLLSFRVHFSLAVHDAVYWQAPLLNC